MAATVASPGVLCQSPHLSASAAGTDQRQVEDRARARLTGHPRLVGQLLGGDLGWGVVSGVQAARRADRVDGVERRPAVGTQQELPVPVHATAEPPHVEAIAQAGLQIAVADTRAEEAVDLLAIRRPAKAQYRR